MDRRTTLGRRRGGGRRRKHSPGEDPAQLGLWDPIPSQPAQTPPPTTLFPASDPAPTSPALTLAPLPPHRAEPSDATATPPTTTEPDPAPAPTSNLAVSPAAAPNQPPINVVRVPPAASFTATATPTKGTRPEPPGLPAATPASVSPFPPSNGATYIGASSLGGPGPGAEPPFRPVGQEDLAPSGARARVDANLAAIETLRRIQSERRPATLAEKQTMARWSSWGAVPALFDEDRLEWAMERQRLRSLLDDADYQAARRATVNAHFTDAAYVREIWDSVGNLGFTAGRVLEPGCGAGVFIGMAPPDAEVTGVELDPTSAQIAKALYPDATIRCESFARTRLPDSSFDLVIGNVPFGDIKLYDPAHNSGRRHSIHNHFIVKSLALTKPGGLVAVITSRYTLDAENDAARAEIYGLAELVGAVRLPTTAHQRAAGTRVVTDLLILRRREHAAPAGPAAWLGSTRRDLGGVEIATNLYFDANPDHVVGHYELDRGVRGAPTLGVEHRGASIASDLRKVLRTITTASAQPEPMPEDEGDHRDGHIVAKVDGDFARLEDGEHVPFHVPVKQRPELRALLQLRDDVRALLAKEATTSGDHPSLDTLRASARARYARYLARYGPINRFAQRRTGRHDEHGEPKMARVVPPVMRILRSDPHAPLVAALEVFDEKTQQAVPAAMLSRRTLHPRAPITTAETPADALAVCLEQLGRVDLARIGSLLGVPLDAARDALGALVFEDPEDGELVPAAEYLSGEVRSKLAAAKRAAARDPLFTPNVAALTDVQPVDLGPEEVHAQLGAGWIDAETHQAFLREILADPGAQVESAGRGIWEVRGNRTSIAATREWGTGRVDAPEIIRAIVEQRPIEVHDLTVDDRRILNAEETAAANEKADALRERFSEWVWESPERTTRLLRVYNDLYNGWVQRDYSAEGERLTLPGLAAWFTPLGHQRTGVARMINEPAVGLFHCTGAGKTAEMVMGIMELRRLGMVGKPVVVVPNHMLEQFMREWIQLYPQTMLLAASTDDLTSDRRRNFVARVATNDWDVVLMTRTGFERLPVRPETAAAYLEAEIAEMREMLAVAETGARLTVKRVEKAIARFEARVEELLDGEVDPAVTWEATGCDYIGCDEAHDYKNLHTVSHIPDAAIEGSRRASDMHLKLDHLRRTHGNRVATFMTATPIANSVTEMHVMTRFLRPDLLQRLGLVAFDAWAAVFGQTVTQIEMAPSGGGNYRLKTRFASFKNAPELLSIFHVFADVKTPLS